MLAVILVHLC